MAFAPRFTITNAITTALTEIERARGFLEAATLTDEWVDAMRSEAFLLEAHHTTHIEGTRLTLEDADDLLAGRAVPGADPDDARELLNYREAFAITGIYFNDGRACRQLRLNLRQTCATTCDRLVTLRQATRVAHGPVRDEKWVCSGRSKRAGAASSLKHGGRSGLTQAWCAQPAHSNVAGALWSCALRRIAVQQSVAHGPDDHFLNGLGADLVTDNVDGVADG